MLLFIVNIHSGGFRKWNSVGLEKEFDVCSQVESILSAQDCCIHHRMLSFDDISLYISVRNRIDFVTPVLVHANANFLYYSVFENL